MVLTATSFFELLGDICTFVTTQGHIHFLFHTILFILSCTFANKDTIMQASKYRYIIAILFICFVYSSCNKNQQPTTGGAIPNNTINVSFSKAIYNGVVKYAYSHPPVS